MPTPSIRCPRSAHRQQMGLHTQPHLHLVHPGQENTAPHHGPRPRAPARIHAHLTQCRWQTSPGLRRGSAGAADRAGHTNAVPSISKLMPSSAQRSQRRQPQFPAHPCTFPSARAPKPPHTPISGPRQPPHGASQT